MPDHPLYASAREFRHTPKTWKNLNVPGLKTAAGHIMSAGIDLSQEVPMLPQRIEPPWVAQPIELKYFPMTKMEALSNSAAAKALFHELESNLSLARKSYTDGSAQQDTGKTTYGVYIPSLEVEESGTMRKGTSIFTAEAHAILRAMEITYGHDEWTEELAILTDSKSVVQALETPSHVGIPGNERADQLAVKESLNLVATKEICNLLSTGEQEAILREHLRSRTGMLKWHIHKSRQVTRTLFRLRSGHNRLAANLARFQSELDPACPYCGENETTAHAILHCPATEQQTPNTKLAMPW